ncbi:MAG: TIGR01777 family oxidoreductase [Chitinophagales bacterium]
MKKKIVIAGGTGFLAQCIYRNMPDEDIEFVALTREPESAFVPDSRITFVEWDGCTIGDWQKQLEGAEAVINMAGYSVNCRYTTENKKRIIQSRVDSTNAIGIAINRCEVAPRVWINAGSAAIYGNRGAEVLTEESAPGEGFSTYVCKQWEETFYDIITPLTRKVFLRIGFVLGRDGGALKPIHALATFGLGGKQGGGQQYISWIHERDFSGIVEHAINNNAIEGTYNCTAPTPLTNAEFMATVKDVEQNKIAIPCPDWLLRAGAVPIRTEPELILNGRRVVPERLLKAGYSFQYTELWLALQELFGHTAIRGAVTDQKIKKAKSTIAWWIVFGLVICFSPLLAFLGEYGSTLFLILPTSVGFTWAMLKSRNKLQSFGKLISSTALIGVMLCFLFILAGAEGLICVAMALPIIVPLMAIGAVFAYFVQSKVWARIYAPMLVLLINPIGILYDLKLQDFESSKITTEITVHASDKQVWHQLENPFGFGATNYFFLKRGVSYPTAMKLEKKDNCNFLACNYSNGNLTATVDSLEKNRLLHFRFKEAPISMSETSIYPNIEPEHIRSKFFIDYGEFRIIPINDTTCKVLATTAYKYKVGPTWYWRLWSDRLVNQIHEHVLEKLKVKTELSANAASR